MRSDRSIDRNIHFYDATSREAALGGLIQCGSLTEANFLDCLGVLLTTESPIRVQARVSGHVVSRTGNPIEPGEYDIYCDSRCSRCMFLGGLLINLASNRFDYRQQRAVGESSAGDPSQRIGWGRWVCEQSPFA